MRLLAATDVHSATDTFSRILADAGPVDLVLLGGDLTNFGSPKDAEAVVRLAQEKKGDRHRLPVGPSGAAHKRSQSPFFAGVLAVAGNCDSAAIDAHLAELGVSLLRRGVVIGNVGLVGLSAMPPWQRTMYHFSEEELAEILEAGHRQVAETERLVVLSHAPPYGTRVDRTLFGRHVGSTALRTFVERARPELVVCGHIHEARGVDRLGRTTLVNCGPAAKGYYAVIDLPDDSSGPRVELRSV